MSTRTRFSRWAPRVALGLAGVMALSGVYAFRAVFSRPGEATLALVPVDALMVASMDLSPSPGQALTFKKIDDALSRNGVDEPFQRSILDLIEHSPDARPLRELTTRSASFCLLPGADKPKDVQPVLFMPVTDSSLAASILKMHAYARFWKGTSYYVFSHSNSDMMVEGDTLVVSSSPEALHEVAQVSSGQVASILKSPGYQDARQQEPGDANLMAFVSPKLIELEGKDAGMKFDGWVGASLTLQDGGLAFGAHAKYNDPNAAPFNKIASTAPLRQDLESVLPDGAYAVFAVSQPGKLSQAAESSLSEGDASKGVDKAKKSLTKETGIDADNDLIPAFMGDTVFAAYPSQAPEAGIDLLAVVDNQNGADPTALADKFEEYVNRQATKDKDMGANWLTKIDRSGVTAFRLSDKVQDQMRKGMSGDGGGSDPIRRDVLFGHKTVAWAKVNGAVVMATSEELLNKALDAYQGKGHSLVADPVLKAAVDTADGSQSLTAISFSRIAMGVKNTLDASKMDSNDRKTFGQALDAFQGLDQPLAVRSRVSPDGRASASVFIPIDYDKMIDFVGGLSKKH